MKDVCICKMCLRSIQNKLFFLRKATAKAPPSTSLAALVEPTEASRIRSWQDHLRSIAVVALCNRRVLYVRAGWGGGGRSWMFFDVEDIGISASTLIMHDPIMLSCWEVIAGTRTCFILFGEKLYPVVPNQTKYR